MNWRDSLLPASFRGVAFHVEAAAGSRGRRAAVHQYPGRDQPFAEDLGRRVRDDTVEAFVLGADHVAQAERLIAACEAAGAATLVHPYLGRMTVACTDCRPSWSTARGGMTQLSLTFIEPGERRYPESRADAKAKVDTLAGKAQTALGTALAAISALRSLPSYIAEAASTVIGNAAGAVMDALGGEAMSALDRAGLSRDGLALARQASQMVFEPAGLARQVSSLMSVDRWTGLVAEAALGPGWGGLARRIGGEVAGGIAWSAYAPLFDFDGSSAGGLPALRPMPLGPTTANRQREQTIVAAHTALVRKAALIEASRAVVAVASEVTSGDPARLTAAQQRDFETADGALSVRRELSRRLDAEARAAGNDIEFRALSELRVAVARSLSDAAPRLPLLRRIRSETTLPAIVVVHRLFGDDVAQLTARADALVVRNRLRHPLFVPGQRTLQVVSGGTVT